MVSYHSNRSVAALREGMGGSDFLKKCYLCHNMKRNDVRLSNVKINGWLYSAIDQYKALKTH